MADYEPGMYILYDVIKKNVLVEFRGKSHFLSGPFASRSAAIAAGEALCRELGWVPENEQSKSKGTS
ncbi:MAG: hypothetical protein QHC90_01540 [Shinella sp.]|nr:hypothetical protein [Shinella sp.]